MSTEPMESHGLRMPPSTWRRIERLASANDMDRSQWIRKQIDAVLSLVADVHDMHESGRIIPSGDIVFAEESHA